MKSENARGRCCRGCQEDFERADTERCQTPGIGGFPHNAKRQQRNGAPQPSPFTRHPPVRQAAESKLKLETERHLTGEADAAETPEPGAAAEPNDSRQLLGPGPPRPHLARRPGGAAPPAERGLGRRREPLPLPPHLVDARCASGKSRHIPRREGGPSPVRGPSAAAQRRHYRPATDTKRRRRRLIGNSRENRPTADLPSMAPSRRAPSAPAAILGAARPPFPPSAAGVPRSPSSGCWCKARTWQC
ncbi:brain acid soluble protein 1-like [Vidua macroura]|uniref:brain acid soluble protein 1-like n=1 Tax=Vidua macroura TaxID=187451 RepID=UPI0023A7BACA|nr:brain acid soluble protein 1-like [Vidua macroura]